MKNLPRIKSMIGAACLIIATAPILAQETDPFAFDREAFDQRTKAEFTVLKAAVFPSLQKSKRIDCFRVADNAPQMIWSGVDAIPAAHISVITIPNEVEVISGRLEAGLAQNNLTPVCHRPETILLFSGGTRPVWVSLSRSCGNIRFRFIEESQVREMTLSFDFSVSAKDESWPLSPPQSPQ